MCQNIDQNVGENINSPANIQGTYFIDSFSHFLKTNFTEKLESLNETIIDFSGI
jgi:hypothetical protein